MTLFSFHTKRTETKKAASAKRTFVPRLETLESRDLPSTFTVINTASDPNTSGSLPWAVQQANSTPGLNYITFNIPGSGIHTINLNSALLLTNQVVIDGTSQPGYNGTPLISVQGGDLDLFELGNSSSGSTIQGLDMYDFTDGAVAIFSGTGNFIQNNWIGFFRDPTTGQVSLNYNEGEYNSSHVAVGIEVWGSNNNVIRNNVIDGTAYAGIEVVASTSAEGLPPITPSNNNSIVANFIGTDPSGTTAAGYGNLGNGIFIGGNPAAGGANEGNWIAMNVIAGNGQSGVVLGNATSNTVSQNWIGESSNGQSFPNGNYGVNLLSGANDNYIGQNNFGPNGEGSVYVDPNAVGNYIGYTPQPTPSSFSAQIQQLFKYFAVMGQAVETRDVSALSQALQNFVSSYVAVELEILNSILRI